MGFFFSSPFPSAILSSRSKGEAKVLSDVLKGPMTNPNPIPASERSLGNVE